MTRITSARRVALCGVILLSGCLLVSACGGGIAGPESAAAGRAAHSAVNGPEPGPASAPNALAAPATVPRAAGSSAAGGAAASTRSAHLVPTSQSIVYTASMTLRSANAMATAKQAVDIVEAAGGYTSAENAVAGTPGTSGGTVDLTLKIPVVAYQQVLADLTAPSLGKKITLTQQATDVTQQVADVNSLVTSQQAAINALQGLLRRAASVDQLLQVQQQISGDESNLESLLAQQRALDHETSYATVNMTLLSTTHPAAARKHHSSTGFAAGLGSGWRAMRHAVSWLLTALGAALPFLVVAAVLAGIGYAGRRRVVRRRAGPTAAG